MDARMRLIQWVAGRFGVKWFDAWGPSARMTNFGTGTWGVFQCDR